MGSVVIQLYAGKCMSSVDQVLVGYILIKNHILHII